MTTDKIAPRVLPPEFASYVDGLPAGQIELFVQLHRAILDAAPDVRMTLSYKLPTYIGPAGRLSLSGASGATSGVSIVTTDQEPIRRFTAKHSDLHSGKVSVRFAPGVALPLDDIRGLVMDAVTARSG